MALADAFASIENDNYNKVLQQTWGHQAPEANQKYPVTILFCYGDYGDIIPIKVDQGDLPDSPWFFDQMNDFIAEKATEQGKVYRFTGTYEMFKNGNCRFSGKTVIVI